MSEHFRRGVAHQFQLVLIGAGHPLHHRCKGVAATVWSVFSPLDTIDFYVDMAKAFLDDKDAGPDKLAKYYQYVVR